MHIGRMPHEEKSRVWGNVAEAKEHQRLLANQKLGKPHGIDCPA